MIFSYNPKGVGDVLMIVVADGINKEVEAKRAGDVARVFDKETGETLGWNLFEASKHLGTIEGNGAVELTDDQLNTVNQLLSEEGFQEKVIQDKGPKFVVGYVKECRPHEDSDHLSVTSIEVDNGEELQIVCGAPNIKQGLKVVVAKVGAMMPDGLIIWPGKLRGVESFGMVCSARELGLPNAPQKKGILELPEDAVVGSAFEY